MQLSLPMALQEGILLLNFGKVNTVVYKLSGVTDAVHTLLLLVISFPFCFHNRIYLT